MDAEQYSDAALVLVAHGSTANADSGRAAQRQAERLSQQQGFGEVVACYWKQDPRVLPTLEALRYPRVFIVPFMMSEGYFSEEVIPRELGFARARDGDWVRLRRRGDQVWFYARAVGTHPAMADLVRDQALRVLQAHPFPGVPVLRDTTLFVAGHGTLQHARSRQAIEAAAARVRAQAQFAHVQAVFLEEEPRIADCLGLAPTRNVVVVPLFISDGLHVNEDIPVLLGENEATVRARLERGRPPWRNPTERGGRWVWYASSAGEDPALANVILERVREVGSL